MLTSPHTVQYNKYLKFQNFKYFIILFIGTVIGTIGMSFVETPPAAAIIQGMNERTELKVKQDNLINRITHAERQLKQLRVDVDTLIGG